MDKAVRHKIATLRQVSRAYERARHDYNDAREFGNTDKADEALARQQEIEKGVTIFVDPRLEL